MEVQGIVEFSFCISSLDPMILPFEDEFIVATGKGEPSVVMSEYGFKRVVSLDEYASYFDNIDPVGRYKSWTTKPGSECIRNSESIVSNIYVQSTRVKAAFVVSDPVDWGRDIQVLCDILTSGGLPGQKKEQQPPLYFAADDLEYQATFPRKRLGMGAFRIALESVFNRIHEKALQYTSFGKPNPFVYKNAEMMLGHILQLLTPGNDIMKSAYVGSHSFKTLYMIGDNPFVDVRGAEQAFFSRKRTIPTLYPADMLRRIILLCCFILSTENGAGC